MKKLSIGAGRGCRTAHLTGWETLDANPDYGPTYVGTVPPLPASVLTQKWDLIEAIHFIEHLYQWEAIEFLKQVWLCLNKGGILVLEQPDFEFCCKVVAGVIDVGKSKKPEYLGKMAIFGEQRKHDVWQAHKWGYSPEELKETLIQCGFLDRNIKILKATKHRPVRDFRIEATK
jgi:predicted SAM-dependent methyltransferase